MASLNKVQLIGNLGRSPEVRYTASGAAVCNLAVATSRTWKDKTSGERQEETEWHRVTLYDVQAENAGKYLHKGSSVYVEGRLKTTKWTDKDGIEKYTTEVIAQEIKYLDKRPEGETQQRQQAPARTAPTQQRSAPPQRQAAAPKPSTGFDDMDDDIPFTSACESFDLATLAQRRMKRYRGV
jgi:single-strand DNA-binding protein